MVADCASASGWEKICFFDDAKSGQLLGGWQVAGAGADLLELLPEFDGVVVAMGDNRTRLAWHRRLSGVSAPMVSLVHPRGWVSPKATLAPGAVVFAGGVVNIGAQIGAAAIINTAASVDHDCIVADGVHLSPGARLAGEVRIGESSWIGIGAVVREGVTVGADVIVGAGAAVVRSIPDGLTMVGVPARPLKERGDA